MRHAVKVDIDPVSLGRIGHAEAERGPTWPCPAPPWIAPPPIATCSKMFGRPHARPESRREIGTERIIAPKLSVWHLARPRRFDRRPPRRAIEDLPRNGLPRARAEAGGDLCLARPAIIAIERQPLDAGDEFRSRVQVEIGGERAAGFGQRRCPRAQWNLAVPQRLRDRKTPAFIVARIQREEAVPVELVELLVRYTGQHQDFGFQLGARVEIVMDGSIHPAGVSDTDELGDASCAVPLDQPRPGLEGETVVLAWLDGRHEKYVRVALQAVAGEDRRTDRAAATLRHRIQRHDLDSVLVDRPFEEGADLHQVAARRMRIDQIEIGVLEHADSPGHEVAHEQRRA